MGSHVLVEWMSSGSYNVMCFTVRHVLLEDMFYLKICIIRGHALQFKIPSWSTYFTGGHILQDDLSYRRTRHMRTGFYWRVCPIGSHVLHEGMSYRWTCLTGVHLDMWTCFIGWHVMQRVCITGRRGSGGMSHENVLWEVMSSKWACLTGRHVLWEVMYYGGTYLMQVYVLKEDMSYSRTYSEVRNVIHDDPFKV